MNHSQSMLVQSWKVFIASTSLALILLAIFEARYWLLPLLIAAPIFSHLRKKAGITKFWLFNYMSEKTKLFIVVYCIFLGGCMAYFLSAKPYLISDNVGVFIVLALLPLIFIAIKAERQLFTQLGKENA